MMAPLIAAGFGLVLLSTVFLVVVFWRAYRDPAIHFGHRYRIVASAMSVGSLGVAIWTLSPLSQAMGGPELHSGAMVLASALILVSSAAMIGSTAIGGAPQTLAWFLVLSVIWVSACLIWGYLV